MSEMIAEVARILADYQTSYVEDGEANELTEAIDACYERFGERLRAMLPALVERLDGPDWCKALFVEQSHDRDVFKRALCSPLSVLRYAGARGICGSSDVFAKEEVEALLAIEQNPMVRSAMETSLKFWDEH